MASCPREFYRLPTVDGDVWVDYVADTGDGFNATFAMARCVARESGLTSEEFPGGKDPADLLVLGGDQVYPVASAEQYRKRLNTVLGEAKVLAGFDGKPPLVALPGNHDWYDGLVSFRRNFCESWVMREHAAQTTMPVPPAEQRDSVGGWGAFQSRSYFAVQLNENWWLWGLDSQLDAPIDAEQLAYFHEAQTLLGDADLILCTATPCWLEAAGDTTHTAKADKPLYTMLWFIDRILGAEHRDRVRLILTGDKHHYARYVRTEGKPGPELVTCGGGGAFLGSTHHLPESLEPAWRPWVSEPDDSTRYELTSSYPTADQSKKLAWQRFLTAGWRNGFSLPLLIGAIDTTLFLLLLFQRWVGFGVVTGVLTVLLSAYAASGTKDRWSGLWRFAAAVGFGVVHTAAHVGSAALVAWLAHVVRPDERPWYIFVGAVLALIPLGTMVFVTYLRLADVAGCHTLEAFSGMRIEDYKCHLRLRIGKDQVTVYVIGMDDVPIAAVKPKPHVVETFTVHKRK